MPIDILTLARLQFGATASFHIIFPSLILGLAWYLTVMEALWLRTNNDVYRAQYQFWIKPFAVVFVIGVVTGVVLSYQLDMIFGGLYQKTKDILTPIREVEFAAAVIFEGGCFGIMVWGWKKVGERLHFLATLAVTLGAMVSAVCILARNSWMQTPAGVTLSAGRLMLESQLAAILSPSFPYRFAHALGGAFLSTALFILGISAWYLLRQRHQLFARYSFRTALAVIAVTAPLQIFSGDLHGLNTKQYQPAKLAAMEAIWETARGVPLVLFALPNMEQEVNRYALEIPNLASLILTHEADGEIRGLKDFPRADRPNVPLVFYSFRIMVGGGMLIMAVPLIWLLVLRRRDPRHNHWFLWLCCAMLPSGLIATIAGWCVAEAGRQPWAIFGVTRTADILNATPVTHLAQSISFLAAVYVAIFVVFVAYLWRVVATGPAAAEA